MLTQRNRFHRAPLSYFPELDSSTSVINTLSSAVVENGLHPRVSTKTVPPKENANSKVPTIATNTSSQQGSVIPSWLETKANQRQTLSVPFKNTKPPFRDSLLTNSQEKPFLNSTKTYAKKTWEKSPRKQTDLSHYDYL